jgi:hypothetical protein
VLISCGRFEVYLDDGSAKQRCRVASEVVQRWLQGVDAPGLAAMSESARNVAVSKLKQFLMKAEGMWALEFNGGTGEESPRPRRSPLVCPLPTVPR